MSPVVSVTAVLVVGSLSRQVVGPVAPRTVAVHVPPVPVMVVLVPVLLILMVPVTAPRRVAVATAVAELSVPLPVSSICGERKHGLIVSRSSSSGSLLLKFKPKG